MIKKRNKSKSATLFIAVFILPTLVVYSIFGIYPVIKGLITSFYKWSGYSNVMKFVGLRNYNRLFKDNVFLKSIWNDFVILFWKEIIIIAIALLFAVGLTRMKLNKKSTSFFRFIFFFPNVLSIIIIGILWSFIYHPSIGMLNGALKTMGLEFLCHTWLGDKNTALGALIPIACWAGIGLFMIVFIAGINNISEELYESANLDGAGTFRQFLSVTLPGLWEQMKFCKQEKDGQQVWTYVCGGPPTTITQDGPDYGGLNRAINNPFCHPRLMNWGCYTNNLTGFYHWGYDFWLSDENNPYGMHSKTSCPLGDGWIIYPDKDNATVKTSIRAVSTRDGAEDYEIFKILEDKDALSAKSIAQSIIRNFNIGQYEQDPVKIISARKTLLSFFGAGYNNPLAPEQMDINVNELNNGQVKVSWDAYQDANTYKVKYALDGDELTHVISSVSGNEVVFSVVSGFPYTITVEAYKDDNLLTSRSLKYTNNQNPVSEGGSISLQGYACAYKDGPKTLDVNLSEGNPLDWVRYGETGALSVEHKNGVVNQIGMKPIRGGFGQVRDSEIYFSWNDGTNEVTKSRSRLGSCMFDDAGQTNGDAWILNAPAGKESKTLTVYTGSYACDIKISAYLSDGSSVPLTYTSSSTTNDYQKINITYKAASDNQLLIVKGSVLDKANRWANMCLFAAVLNDTNSMSKPDITALKDKIIEAEKLSAEGWLPASYQALQTEIQNAKSALNTVIIDTDVQKAIERLQAAMDALASDEDIVWDSLEAKIKQAEAIEQGNYTEESYQTLKLAIDKAKTDRNTVCSQGDVDKIVSNLQIAIENLKEKILVDKSPLSQRIALAEKVKIDGYTEKSFEALQQAITTAKEAMKTVTDKTGVDEAVNVLQKALDALEYTLTDPVRYEFENGILLGDVSIGDTNYATGFSGTGFVRRIYKEGLGVRLLAGSAKGGMQRLDISYVRGMDSSTTLGLFVNNQFVRHLEYPSTSSWIKDWQTISYAVDLKPGLNIIDVKRCKDDGDVDIDCLILYPDNSENIESYITDSVQSKVMPTLDGNVSDWDLNKQLEKIVVGPENTDKNHGRFGVKFDSNNLYLGIEIQDAVQKYDSNTEIFDNDSIEIYLNSQNVHLPYDLDTVCLTVSYDGAYIKANKANFPIDKIQKAAVTTDTGYTLELSIPWDSLNIVPHETWEIGMDIFNNDRDGDKTYTIGWAGNTNNYFNNTMLFGTAKFYLTIDKDDLNTVIASCNDLKEEAFETAAWVEFQNVLSKAKQVVADNQATQNDVDSVKDELTVAKQVLLETLASKAELQKLVDDVSLLKEESYTTETWAAVKQALDVAKTLLNSENPDYYALDKAFRALVDAKNNLEKNEPTDSTTNTTDATTSTTDATTNTTDATTSTTDATTNTTDATTSTIDVTTNTTDAVTSTTKVTDTTTDATENNNPKTGNAVPALAMILVLVASGCAVLNRKRHN